MRGTATAHKFAQSFPTGAPPIRRLLFLMSAALVSCGGTEPLRPEPPGDSTVVTVDTDPLSGGDMTVFDATNQAFGQPGPALSAAQLAEHAAGDHAFDAVFVPAPAAMNSGLGPRFDNVACGQCHVNDGRGAPPAPGQPFATMLFRVSVPGTDAHGGPAPAPGYGTQLELRVGGGLAPQAQMSVQYSDSVDTFADGTPDTLHVPHYSIGAPYRPLPSGLMLSPRVSPPNFGLGLLEAVPEATIRGLALDAEAVEADVSGFANTVWDPTAQRNVLGRFGLKANVGSLLQQTVGALNADIGVTSSLLPDEPCDDPIPACAAHPPDASDSLVAALTAYIRTLAVPARRNVNDPTVQHGQQLFNDAGCALCHIPTLHTGTVPGEPELSNQRIHPYTDLLLHDMGKALADGRPDYLANGAMWRTPPLWGIGLTSVVNGNLRFLHDGRAQSLLEAVMWHGGQGVAARERVRRMSRADRSALIAFLMSL